MGRAGEFLGRLAGADTAEPLTARDYRRAAWLTVFVVPALAAGNVLSRQVLSGDDPGLLAKYDQFLRLNLPGHGLMLVIALWMVLGARSARAYRSAIYLLIPIAVWTSVTGLWIRGSLTHFVGLLLVVVFITTVRVYFDWRIGVAAFVTAVLMHAGLVGLEAAGQVPPHPLHPELMTVEYRSSAYMIGHFSWILLIYLLAFVFASFVARKFRQGENALRDLNSSLERKVSEQVAHIERVNRLRRYVAPQVAEHMIESEVDPSDMRDRRVISVLFADLRGFTELTEKLDPGELEQLLNKYFTEVTSAAYDHGGTIDKFIGDAVMILFGAPQATGEADQALRCVRTAVDIQARLTPLDYKVRIGIATGESTVGSFGSAQRTEFTAFGVPVNRAARLEPLAPSGRVLIDERTHELVAGQVEATPFGEVELKGFAEPVRAFEVAS